MYVSLQKKKIDRSLVIYDGDSAGREGAYETGKILHYSNIETWIGQLPEGRDPADILSTEGAEVFRKKVDGKPFQKIQMHRELDRYSIEEIQAYLHERVTNNE